MAIEQFDCGLKGTGSQNSKKNCGLAMNFSLMSDSAMCFLRMILPFGMIALSVGLKLCLKPCDDYYFERGSLTEKNIEKSEFGWVEEV